MRRRDHPTSIERRPTGHRRQPKPGPESPVNTGQLDPKRRKPELPDLPHVVRFLVVPRVAQRAAV